MRSVADMLGFGGECCRYKLGEPDFERLCRQRKVKAIAADEAGAKLLEREVGVARDESGSPSALSSATAGEGETDAGR